MAGLQFPTEVLGGLSWNRLIRETYVAQPVPDSILAKRSAIIPPVAIQGNGYIYLIGCHSESASPTWRLGCSVRLSSDGSPDSGGIFTNPGSLPIRIDDRKPCTLGSYTLLTWPNLEIEQPWLVIEFPYWLDDIQVEIFWYDGAVTANSFEQVRQAIIELYQDPDFPENIDSAVSDYVDEALEAHLQEANPHPQYLTKEEAGENYATPEFVNEEIDKTQLLTERLFDEHLSESNPHDLTPEDIDAVRSRRVEELEDEVLLLKRQSFNESNFASIFSSYATPRETLPITPAQIGAVSNEDLEGKIGQHLSESNPHQITAEAINAMSNIWEPVEFSLSTGWVAYWPTKAYRMGPLGVICGLVTQHGSRKLNVARIGSAHPSFYRMNKVWCYQSSRHKAARLDLYPDGTISLRYVENDDGTQLSWLMLPDIYWI